MRICAGLLRPDAGTVTLGGRLGYCPQAPGVFELLTADDHLVMFGRGVGLDRAESLRRGRAILEEFGYPLDERDVTRELSGGSRQKLNLALALLADPAVLLLDEPYQGFDHGTYVNFWDHCDTWRRRREVRAGGHPHARRARSRRPHRRAARPPVAPAGRGAPAVSAAAAGRHDGRDARA